MALCDEEVEKAQDLARKFAVPHLYADLEEMLEREELDLVDICVPPHRHGEALVKVLEKGLPCLVEKPLTVATADADAIIALAKSKGAPLFVLHTYSFVPGVMKAKELVARGAVGRIAGVHITYATPWAPRHLDPGHWCRNLPGDYFSEAAPHMAMLLVEFLGPVREAKAMATKFARHPAVRLDELRILARSVGALGSITCSLNCPSRLLTIDIFGTEGALHVDGNSQAVVRYGPLASSQDAWARGLAALRDILCQTVALAGTTTSVLLGRRPLEIYGHHYLIQRCLRALRGEEEYPVDVEKAREAVHLLEIAFEAL
jgi:predicted dehydrogenase